MADLRLSEGTLLFEVMVTLDRLLNILTGGSMGVCLSTRAYIRSHTASTIRARKYWTYFRRFVDFLFWNEHCKGSWEWEVHLKQKWVDDNTDIEEKEFGKD